MEYAALWVISADGGEAKELLNAGSRAAYMPTLAGWSPDGQHILFWRDSYFVNTAHGGIGNPDPADTNRLYKISIVNSSLSPLAEGVIGYPPFVVPGPRAEDEVVVVAGIPGAYCGNLTSTWTSKKLHLISAAYGEGSAFTPEDMAASSPQWSPDGTRIAFVAMPDQGCRYCDNNVVLDSSMKRHIWMANTHGMPELIQLTSDPAYRDEYPIWSADGSHLLFSHASLPKRVVGELKFHYGF